MEVKVERTKRRTITGGRELARFGEVARPLVFSFRRTPGNQRDELRQVERRRTGSTWLIVVGVVFATVTGQVLAQGTFVFNNQVPTAGIDAPVFNDGVRLAGSAYLAQAYVGQNAGNLSAVGMPVGFLTGAGAGYIANSIVTVQFIAPGQPAIVEMRAWDGAFATYAAAVAGGAKTGKSVQINIMLGGGGIPPLPPTPMIGLQPFAVSVVATVITLTLGIPDLESGTPSDSETSQLCSSTIVGTVTHYIKPSSPGQTRVYTKNSPFPATLAAFDTFGYDLANPLACGTRQGNDSTLEFLAVQGRIYPIVIGRLSGTAANVDITYELLESTTRIRLGTFSPSGSLTLSCDTLTGGRYTLESKDSVSQSTWAEVDSLLGTGGSGIFTDNRARAVSRFYRARIETVP